VRGNGGMWRGRSRQYLQTLFKETELTKHDLAAADHITCRIRVYSAHPNKAPGQDILNGC